MRFDDPGYVKAWREKHVYPDIHCRLVTLIRQEAEGRRFIDLCASTGLLGRQLTDRGFHGVAVERDRNAILNGVYSNDFLALELAITPATLPDLSSWMRAAGVTVAIARRCLPELHDAGVTPDALGAALVEGGADELFIEGRVYSARSKHPLSSVEAEVGAISQRFVVAGVSGTSCVYLRRRGSYVPAAISLSTEGSPPVIAGESPSSSGPVSS